MSEEKNLDKLVGINLDKPIKSVKHAELTRATDDSPHKSVCPECKEGWLLMMRDAETFKLRKYDYCMLCGQRFEYSDVPDNELSFISPK